jgi:hypothetical protein
MMKAHQRPNTGNNIILTHRELIYLLFLRNLYMEIEPLHQTILIYIKKSLNMSTGYMEFVTDLHCTSTRAFKVFQVYQYLLVFSDSTLIKI